MVGFYNGGKGVGPVVAISLLLVVAVAATVSFSSWSNTYVSNLEAKSERQSSEFVNINRLIKIGTTQSIYIFNSGQNYEPIVELRVDGTTCTLPGSDVVGENGVTRVDVTGCSFTTGTKHDVLLRTNSGVVFEEIIAN